MPALIRACQLVEELGAGEIIGGIGVSGGSEAEDTALSAYGKAYFEQKR